MQARLQNTTPIDTPLELNVKYQKDDKRPYKSYNLLEACWKSYLLTITQPNISHAVLLVGQFMNQPTHHKLSILKRIIHYLLRIPECGIFYPANSKLILTPYYDADWVGCPESKWQDGVFILAML